MSWIQQINGWIVGIIISLLAALVGLLIKSVWKKAPQHGTLFQRLRIAGRRAPLAAWTVGIVLTGIVVLGALTSMALASTGSIPEAVLPPAPHFSPPPSTTPMPTPIAKGGWGPARDLATHDNRPDSAMLNSVVDDPTVGDERGFMAIRLADDENASWRSSAIAVPGKVYQVGVIINNDAKDDGDAAVDVRLRLQMPAVARGSAPSHAFVTASNVTPVEIWDGITLVGENSTDEFALRYVTDSAVLYTGGDAQGTVLPDTLFTRGVLVGCDKLDGTLPAGRRCQSWVSFRVKVDQPNFDVAAFAKLDGTDAWSETFVASPGQQVTLMGTYKNSGTTQQHDVVFSADLPDNMHYVRGSTVWTNARTKDVPATNDEIVGEGINVGSYAPGGGVWVKFDVIVDAGPPGVVTQELKDFITVRTSNGNKGAQINVVWL